MCHLSKEVLQASANVYVVVVFQRARRYSGVLGNVVPYQHPCVLLRAVLQWLACIIMTDSFAVGWLLTQP